MRSKSQLRVTRVIELSGREVFEERVKTFYFFILFNEYPLFWIQND